MKPVNDAEVKCRDRNDQKFLDCAHTGRADYLVTGDPDLLTCVRWDEPGYSEQAGSSES